MSTFYWVGGTGTWDTVNAANWSASSGGAGGAGVPTSVDDVVFDASSNATAYTVTIGASVSIQDWTVAGPLVGDVTFAGSSGITITGSLLWPVTGMVRSYTGTTTFSSTSTGKTITTNGKTFGAAVTITGVGGSWTLGSAFTHSAGGFFRVENGATFDTANYNVSSPSILWSSATVNLGSSTVTISVSGNNFQIYGDFVLNAGTSTFSFSATNVNMIAPPLTFYNMQFTAPQAGTINVSAGNTFNNLSFSSRNATGLKFINIQGDQTVNGTLSFNDSGGAPIRRGFVASNQINVQRTFTVAALNAGITNYDFRDIAIAGVASPLTGTRIGDCGGNSGITADAPKTVYWNLAGGGSWSSTAWAPSSGGTANANNFPLAQDTVIIEDTGLNASATVTVDQQWNMSAIDFSTRTLAATFATGSFSLATYGNITLDANVALTGTGTLTFTKRSGTQTITSNSVSFARPITVFASGGTVQFADAMTCTTFTQSAGTVEFAASQTSTATQWNFNGSAIQSTVPNTQFTLSQSSGTVNAINTTAKDCAATGGARWNLINGSINQGNLSGWYVAHQQNAFYPAGMF